MMPLRTAVKTFGGVACTRQVPVLQGLFVVNELRDGEFVRAANWQDIPNVVLYYKGYMCNKCGHSDSSNLQQAHMCTDCKSSDIENIYEETL